MVSGEPERGGVFVLGMHASGTSAVTRMADLLGNPVAVRGLLEPDLTNPAGYWEPGRLLVFNENLLLAMGGWWSAPPPLPVLAGAGRGLRAYAPRAREVFGILHPGPRWVWKDPRNCFTLAFWRAALGEPAAVIVAFREPEEVVASFDRRGILAPEVVLALWERHLRAAVLLSAGLPSLVVDYAALVADPGAVAERMSRFLAEQGLESPPGATEAATASVDARLRRVRGAMSGGPALSEQQVRLAAALRDAAERGAGVGGLDLGAETPTTEYRLTALRAQHWQSQAG